MTATAKARRKAAGVFLPDSLITSRKLAKMAKRLAEDLDISMRLASAVALAQVVRLRAWASKHSPSGVVAEMDHVEMTGIAGFVDPVDSKRVFEGWTASDLFEGREDALRIAPWVLEGLDHAD